MIQNLRHKNLELFYETGSKAGVVTDYAKRLRVLRAHLDAGSRPKDMNLPGTHLHPLSGEWRAYWTVNASGNWRLIFRFRGAEARDVDYLDYH